MKKNQFSKINYENTPICEQQEQVEVEVELDGELGGIFLSLPP